MFDAIVEGVVIIAVCLVVVVVVGVIFIVCVEIVVVSVVECVVMLVIDVIVWRDEVDSDVLRAFVLPFTSCVPDGSPVI